MARLRIPSVYYIPPKVWIWRKDRIEIIKKYFSKILCVFPFEEEFFKNEGVSQAKYVGNPILEELPFSMTRSQARQNMNLASNDLVFTIMPGSRPAEMWNHSLPLLRAVKLAEKELSKRHMIHAQRKLKILVPIVNGMENFFSGFDFSGSSLIEIKLLQHNAHKCLIASDAALVKSGTSTLEAALLGCPYTLFYKPSWMTACIFQYFLKYKGPVGLVNILLGKKNSEDYAVKEILGSEVNAKNLSYEIVQLLVNSEKQNELKKSFLQVMDLLKTKEPPSQLAAHEIFDLVMH
ncbi:MAG: hypothetical protein HY072_06670 [Deltaproteobacteria bacterium]|nr:hypothetical protein [Deltaproteobacteria bacterium]